MGLRVAVLILVFPTICSAQEVYEHPTIRRMHHINNSIRQRYQLSEQRLSPRLTSAAQFQAEYLARTHKFSHYVNGSPGTRAGRYGYEGTVIENIARAYNSVEETFYAWVDSPKHWRAMSNPNTEVGFGYSIADDGTTYWVAVYGTPNEDHEWQASSGHSENSRSSPSPSKVFIRPSSASLPQSNSFLLIGS